jgi:hypothetical protein
VAKSKDCRSRSRRSVLPRVIGAASFQGRFGHKHRSFINPELTTNAAATKRSLNNRQHFRVWRVAPRAHVSGGDADFRPSFHGFGECKAVATHDAHHFSSIRQFLRGFIECQLGSVRLKTVEPSSGYCGVSEMRRDY